MRVISFFSRKKFKLQKAVLLNVFFTGWKYGMIEEKHNDEIILGKKRICKFKITIISDNDGSIKSFVFKTI